MKPKIKFSFTRDFQNFVGTSFSERYWYEKAKDVFTRYPHIKEVNIVDRYYSTSQTRYVPSTGEAILVPSTSGKYGKSSIWRISND